MAQPDLPDGTAVRTALWRALHVAIDAPPHVLTDEVGLALAAPEVGWRARPDMDPERTKLFRAAILARARFVEDLVIEQSARGVAQYVILGAGLDTFVQRRPDVAARMRVFEVDRPAAQRWKQRRLKELGLPKALTFVSTDFETEDAWLQQIIAGGFDPKRPAVIASLGVSMYLSKAANAATLRQVARLAPGSTLVTSFLVPLELADPAIRVGLEFAVKGAAASGTPFLSFFAPQEIVDLAQAAGFKDAKHVSAATLAERYFANRTDGLRPPENAEELLLATT